MFVYIQKAWYFFTNEKLLDVVLNKYTYFSQKKTDIQNRKIISSKGWVKLEVETIVRVASLSHSLFISSFFLLLPSLSITLSFFPLSRSSSCHLFVFQALILVSFLFHIFLLWSISLQTSLFPCLFLISGLLDEAKLDRQGIKDLVNANTRRYQGEVNNLTP